MNKVCINKGENKRKGGRINKGRGEKKTKGIDWKKRWKIKRKLNEEGGKKKRKRKEKREKKPSPGFESRISPGKADLDLNLWITYYW